MRFRFEHLPSVPYHSWCAVIREGSRRVDVLHGSAVETGDDRFVEGAWDGPFDQGTLDGCFLCGSGGFARAESVTILGSSHVFERLLAYDDGTNWLISNSLPFLLAAAGDSLDPNWPFHQNLLFSVLRGVSRAARLLPTRSGNRLHLFYREDVTFSSSRAPEVRPKQSGPAFANYQAYRDELDGVTARLFANAISSSRSHQYSPVATISSGYDSAASAAIAQGGGCHEGVTLRRTSADGTRRDDARPIADALGFELSEHDRYAYVTKGTRLPEAEFLACGFAGEDLPFASMEESLTGRFVVTGAYGDRIWGSSGRGEPSDFARGSAATASLFEFRSRADFLHLPLPTIHAEQGLSIRRITNSTAMDKWRQDGDYARPIPTRILGEAGVDGELLGRKKHGYIAKLSLAHHGEHSETLETPLTQETYVAANAYASRHSRTGRDWLLELRARPLRHLYKRSGKTASRRLMLLSDRLLGLPPEHALNRPYDTDRFLPLWGIDDLTGRYSIDSLR